MILENLEFDGSTVLCRVCGDKASGFHYGVHACEGCKGFFRRSIQQKIQYRPCLKNQQCNIMRVNRNRCQYCRLKKCISVGMSRDAVRFGRVPKKEKAKIMEQMKRVNAQSQMNALHSTLENDQEFLDKIIKAHYNHCDYTNEKVRELIDRAWLQPQFINCPAHMACPLNPKPESPTNTDGSNDKWDDFTEYFTPAIRNVVNFAKNIPGFQTFSQEDQVNLLKAGTFEVLLVHLAPFFDAKHNTMMFANGRLFKRATFNMSSNAGFLLDSMFDFSERMNGLSLNDEEIALFSAAVIVAADRPGLRNIDMVERVQRKIHQGLQLLMKINHREDPSLFPKLLMKIPDLRTLNTLHSEKLLGMTVAPNGQPVAEVKEEIDTVTSPAVDPHEHKAEATRPKTCPFASGKSGSIDSGYPQVGGHPFPLQFPFAPQLPYAMRSQDYSNELLHNAYAMYGTYPPHHHHQLPTIFPQVKQELPDHKSTSTKCPKQWMDMHHHAMPSAEDFSSQMKDKFLLAETVEEQKYADEKEDDSSVLSSEFPPRSPILDVLHDDEDTEVVNEEEFDDNIDVDIHDDDHDLLTGSSSPSLNEVNQSSPSAIQKALVTVIPQPDKNWTRKRSMDMSKHEIQTKISKLQSEDYDIRSSRSDSISSNTSIDSADSAYKTISSPGTPRSLANTDVRSPQQTTHSKSLLKDCLRSHLADETRHKLLLAMDHEKSSDSHSEKPPPPQNLPVLKQALSIPPLVAQDSWFYNPKCKKAASAEHLSGLLLSGSDYSSQTSSRSVSPDELKLSNGKQFKLKKALLERFSPSSHDEGHSSDFETMSDQGRNSTPLSLKSRLLHRAERDSDQPADGTFSGKNEVLDLHVHKNPFSSTTRSSKDDLHLQTDRGGRYTPSQSSRYHDRAKKIHPATITSNHTISSAPTTYSSSPPQSSHRHPCPPLPTPAAYLGLAYPQHHQPVVHPALLYQYSAMQQQFKTLQQLEAHRAVLSSQVEQQQRSQPIADHVLNLAVKKEPL